MRSAILLFLTCIGCWTAPAEEISVAVASNMAHCIEPLTAAFSSGYPGARIQTSQAASGTLAAQIENGAPFDLFLSADAHYPERLVQKGFADASSFRIYTQGV